MFSVYKNSIQIVITLVYYFLLTPIEVYRFVTGTIRFDQSHLGRLLNAKLFARLKINISDI